MEVKIDFIVVKQAVIAVRLIELEAEWKFLTDLKALSPKQFGNEEDTELKIIEAQIKALKERQLT